MTELSPRALAEWCGGAWEHDAPTAIAAVNTDSRAVTPGSLFVALRGENCDGHAYVPAALRAGAAGAVVARDYNAPAAAVPLLRVPDTLRALQDMAQGRRRAAALRVVGVTGSVGKTSVKEMVADVLATRGPVARTRGNWNNHVGLPLSLLNMPAAACAGVFEVGVSHPGEMAPLCRVLAPDWGIVTNVGPVHIEHFGAESAIADEKAGLLRALPADGLAFLRADAPWFDRLRAAAPGRVVAVALAQTAAADFFCVDPPAGAAPAGAVGFAERATGRTCLIRPPLPGRHVLINMLFAAAVARVWGVDWPAIAGALEKYQPPPMRWERQTWREVVVINDAYNANPMSMREALHAFAGLPAARKWIVLGDMLELGDVSEKMHRELGRQAAVHDWQGLIAVGRWAAAVTGAAADNGMPADRLFTCAAPAAAAAILQRIAQPGDMVLLKGSRGVGLEKILAVLDHCV